MSALQSGRERPVRFFEQRTALAEHRFGMEENMKLYLIRHGRQCSRLCNVNVSLDEAGKRQAQLAGMRLKDSGIEEIYASDLLRARETAGIINDSLQVPLKICSGIREISFGEMEGLTDEEIDRKFGTFKSEFSRMERDLPYPGGECAGDVVKRALPVFQEIFDSGLSRAAMVTHGGVIRCMTAYFLRMDLARWRSLGKSLENCSITELEYRKETGMVTVERFNDYAHLEAFPELLRRNW